MGARAIIFNIAFYVVTAGFLLITSPLLLAPRRMAMHVLRLWGLSCIWLMQAIVGTKLEVRGRENIPAGGLLVAAKHQSAWDTFALHTLFADPAMVLKRELMWIPLMGWFSIKFQLIPVDRSAGAGAMRRLRARARRALADARQIIIFPEGTRRAPGAEPAYKPGIALLYSELSVPCLPVALNSGLFWPRRRLERYPGTIIVEILPPIPPGLTRKDFMARLEGAIEEASNRILAETASRTDAPPLPETARQRLEIMSAYR